MENKHLSIDEKRDWLAAIFRDKSGEFSQADKFKAMAEDTRLALLEIEKAPPAPPVPNLNILDQLPPPMKEAQDFRS